MDWNLPSLIGPKHRSLYYWTERAKLNHSSGALKEITKCPCIGKLMRTDEHREYARGEQLKLVENMIKLVMGYGMRAVFHFNIYLRHIKLSIYQSSCMKAARGMEVLGLN